MPLAKRETKNKEKLNAAINQSKETIKLAEECQKFKNFSSLYAQKFNDLKLEYKELEKAYQELNKS